jgi:alkanesulfonate monooxygenase SsuD/methylene tetrahydromethanopterin reductase-like flavin-dependent oxidoreductase (luciferase family)
MPREHERQHERSKGDAMVMSGARFNFVQPGLEPNEMSSRYRAMLDMVELMDRSGVAMVSLEEHHGAPDGWSPAPLVTAGLILGRTHTIGVTISAVLVPLHDPLRLAEDIAVLDLAGGGRLVVIAGIGYRPSEYAAHRKDWSRRGQLLDEALEAMLAAWTGEPFEYHGSMVQVTPRPLTQPHPTLLVGGTSRAAARRAARFGLPFFPADNMPELEAYYYERCAAEGTTGFCMMPSARTTMNFVSEDPDKAWAEVGHHLFHETKTYADWQTPDIRSAVHSHATSVDELRDEGMYQILTPEECIAHAKEGDSGSVIIHPLCGGMPVDRGWDCVNLFVERVLPALA